MINHTRIREEREKTGRTLKAVATECGISFDYLSKIEMGKRVPSLKVLRVICSYYSLPLDLIISTNQQGDK